MSRETWVTDREGTWVTVSGCGDSAICPQRRRAVMLVLSKPEQDGTSADA